ncbi:MAG: hypothetical protein DWQ01_19200 [Planctomycetota bacterium]|nr:MAG: hypothetical protein DWQ01_19200 [Planctomycetota bacterium]
MIMATGVSLPLFTLLGLVATVVLGFMVLARIVKFVAWIFGQVVWLVGNEVKDTLRFAGSLATAVIYIPIILGQIILGRWSAAKHMGKAWYAEVSGAGRSLYRVVLGHPLRFFCLGPLTEGLEKRLPEAVAKTPGPDRPSRKQGDFEGYEVVGSLPSGGSGARLFIADPSSEKRENFQRAGLGEIHQVVLKTFSLEDGSALPQIVRESRALEAARKLGLVLEHGLNEKRFFYAMPYVPGDDFGTVTSRLHQKSDPEGLNRQFLREGLSYVVDLLDTLDRYHQGGLWHKDVKPENVVVSNGRAHLVDLGLVTPLHSGMTLTTHGTEYFRDPELVRQAMRGAKVKDVDGVRFDLYGVGAVLYSLLENSFPAHGSLSQVSKRCPESLTWVIRRAMADLHKRYTSAGEMAGDLRAIMLAPDPFALKLAQLPSVSGEPAPQAAAPPAAPDLAADRHQPVPAWSPKPLRTRSGQAVPPPPAILPPPPPTAVPQLQPPRFGAWRQRRHARRQARREAYRKHRRRQPTTAASLGVALLIAFGIVGLGLGAFSHRQQSHRFKEIQSADRAQRLFAQAQANRGQSSVTMTRDAQGNWILEDGLFREVIPWVDGEFSLVERPPQERGVQIFRGDGRHQQAASHSIPVAEFPFQDERIRNVLVLEDGLSRLPADQESALEHLLEEMENRRLRLLRGVALGDISEDVQLQWLAEARTRLGLEGPSSPEAGRLLQAFLADHPELDAVIWLAMENGDQGIRCRVVGTDSKTAAGLALFLRGATAP